MRLVFIAPSLQQGGLENAVTVMANQMLKLGHEVSIITIYNFKAFYQPDKLITIYTPSFHRKDYSTLFYYIKTIFYLRRAITTLVPDVVISYGEYLNILVLLGTFGKNLRIFISDRSSPLKHFPRPIRILRKWLYPKAVGFIAQSRTAAQSKRKVVGSRTEIRVIPNPIRPMKYNGKVAKRKVILGVGRHYYVKGLDRLIEAFSKLKLDEWELHIAGGHGPETARLTTLVKDYGLEGRVIFLGAVENMDEIYSYSSVYVLSSRSEGFPNALIEAMAHGLPCISFNINSGPDEIITHKKDGLLVEDGNISELVTQIKYVIDNENVMYNLGLNAKQIAERLDIDRVGAEFLEFISKTENCKIS